MTPTDRNSAAARRGDGHAFHQLAVGVRRAVRAVAATLAECNRAQRRMAELKLSPDRFLIDGSDKSPDTYAEFLFRTSGSLTHEPPADKRSSDGRTRR